jgi:hypothetical protein
VATVWAYREGAYTSTASTGWNHVVNFTGPSNLVEQLNDRGLRGKVQHLALVAHGYPGQVLMQGEGNGAISSSWLGREITPFLTSDAMLSFVACTAGGGDNGTLFLCQLSREMPGRVIVAYSVWIGFDNLPFARHPGNVQPAPAMREIPGSYITPWSPWAKWAYMNTIVRLPADEQDRRPNRTCANPSCPGHASSTPNGRVPTLPHCRYASWGSSPLVRRLNP